MQDTDRQHMRLLLAARLSQKKTQTGDIGIETQDERGREWAEREGHSIVHVAADYKSGRVAPWDRPNLKPWVTRPDLMQKYDGILAYKNDRLSRGSWDDETRIRQWASDNRKVLVIVDGPQWPPRDDGDFWAWTAQAKQAEKEWEEIRERSMRARRALLEKGAHVGMVPSWAYTITGERYNHKAVPTEAGKKYIPKIFQRIADGDSLAKVATWARSEGLGSGKISASTIRKMINNRTYMGDRQFRFEGKTFVTEVDPVVDAKLWQQANDRLKNAPVGRRTPVSGNTALLTGCLFCPRCPRDGKHAPMYRIPAGRRPHVHYYYRCAGHYPERKGCGNMVDLAMTDWIVTQTLSLASAAWKDLRLIKGENHDVEQAEIKLAIRDLGTQGLPDDEYDAQLAKLRAERDRIAALPNIPDHWEEVETGETVGQHFTRLDYEGQRAMLLADVRVFAQPPTEQLRKLSPYPMVTIESRLFTLPVMWVGTDES